MAAVRGRLAGQLEDMHAGVGAIDDVDVAAVIHFHIVGLDGNFAMLFRARPHAALVGLVGDRRDEVADFLRMIGIAHVERAHAGVEPREEQDALAVESHRRAANASKEGRFKSQIVPITIKTRKGDIVFDTDEHCKPDTTMETLSKMKAVFKKEGGSVTAGNASGINDGAAAVVLMSADEAKRRGITPMARIVSWATAGVDPAIMGSGPIPASRLALEKAGWKVKDLDLVEANEAFAAQGLAVLRELGLQDDDPRVNPNGGAIALGHPLGASGARLVTTAINQLHRTGGRYALCTMCIGVGQGIAMVIERV